MCTMPPLLSIKIMFSKSFSSHILEALFYMDTVDISQVETEQNVKEPDSCV